MTPSLSILFLRPLKKSPRPGNLWVILTRMTTTTYAAALINNGFNDVAEFRSPTLFRSQFIFSAGHGLRCGHSLFISLPPPCFSSQYDAETPVKWAFRALSYELSVYGRHDQPDWPSGQ